MLGKALFSNSPFPDITFIRVHSLTKQEMENIRHRIRDEFHVLITTYGTMKTNIEYFSTMWSEYDELKERTGGKWDYVILDEGHKIKNSESQTSILLRNIQAHHRVIASGTPLQNNLGEIWSIMDWLCDGKLLGDKKEFTKFFQNPIEQGQDRRADEVTRIYGEEMARELSEMIYNVALRREKMTVLKNIETLKIGKKTEIVLWVYVLNNNTLYFKIILII